MQCNLPLMTLGSHKVKINLTYTPSTSKLFKECFTFSVLDHIQHILNNLSIYPKLYFGPGIEIEEKLELWHGQVWKGSPIFGKHQYNIGNAGDFVLYHVNEKNISQQLGNLRSLDCLNQSKNHAVWLTEEQTTTCIDDNNEKVFVSGGLGMCTADLPQDNNDIAGVQQHNAEHGCCSCEVTQKIFSNLHFDIQANESGDITQWHINYYDSIQFTVKHEADIYINITLQVGDVVDIEEIEQSYEISFPIYILQESNDHTWNHLHPLTIVDRQPKIHFIQAFVLKDLMME
ncbi:9180_t:CDS:2 [Entrophospora sp. SA101]|nr:16663_t:CDS:2 [Entrophospora sp. SA101]CAJ0765363.1 9180_t:CDS:2 [Entrophospora sp. SA101]